MAYTPTEWATGDVITAEKLNKAEEGIAAAATYFDLTDIEPFGLGDLVINTSEAPPSAAFPVPAEAMADGSIVNLSIDGQSVQLSQFVSFNTEPTPEFVANTKYLLPAGTKVRVENSMWYICLYDESVTPIPGELEI